MTSKADEAWKFPGLVCFVIKVVLLLLMQDARDNRFCTSHKGLPGFDCVSENGEACRGCHLDCLVFDDNTTNANDNAALVSEADFAEIENFANSGALALA